MGRIISLISPIPGNLLRPPDSLVVGGSQHPHRNNYIQLRARNSREMSQEIVRSLSRAAFVRAGANLRGRTVVRVYYMLVG